MFTSPLAGVTLSNRSPTLGSLSLLVVKLLSAVIRELLPQLRPLKNWTFLKIHSSLLVLVGNCESLSRDLALARMRKSWYSAASSAVDTPFAGVIVTRAEVADAISKRARMPFVMAVVANFIVVVFLCAFPDDERAERNKSQVVLERMNCHA